MMYLEKELEEANIPLEDNSIEEETNKTFENEGTIYEDESFNNSKGF